MESIRNTTEDMHDPVEASMFLLNQLGSADPGDPTAAIMHMEAEGQRQLVNSDRLPTRVLHTVGGDEAFLALGFTFGPPDSGDSLFRPATLPVGWKRERSDHAMWSYLVDEHGRHRVSIFYKAAFYDRDAHMSLETHYGYLRGVLDGDVLVLDDVWLTRAVAVTELQTIAESLEKQATEADEFARERPDDDYWPGRAVEHRAERDKVLAFSADVQAGRKP